MHLRVITYTVDAGGTSRFIVELLKALKQSRPDARIEFVSHGDCLHHYGGLLRTHGLEIQSQDIKPPAYWRTAPGRVLNIPGTWRLMEALATSLTRWGFEIPPSALDKCDAALVPVLQGHAVPKDARRAVIATFHDTIRLESEAGLLQQTRAREWQLMRRAVASNTQLVTSSETTAARIEELFQLDARAVRVIPLSGDHDRRSLAPFTPNGWPWSNAPYILCPAHLLPHKNHRALFEAFAEIPQGHRLVLTGFRADLPRYSPLAVRLRTLARRRGLRLGQDVIPLGYVTDQTYYGLLQNAWALVMPTLAEGGGSFPVEEAVLQGIPVACSGIPVMREHMQRLGAEVLWFDPYNSADIARTLIELRRNYTFYKQRAQDQVAHVKRRSWSDVALDYWRIIDEAVGA